LERLARHFRLTLENRASLRQRYSQPTADKLFADASATAPLAPPKTRFGQALGYQLEKMLGMEPETLARAGEGNRDALTEIVDILTENAKKRSDEQRPSMAQDIHKGRRTETDFINGYVAAKGLEIGVPADTHAKMNEIVKRVERGELKAAPDNISGI
jgi:2-dehydropantoate 2-reductase